MASFGFGQESMWFGTLKEALECQALMKDSGVRVLGYEKKTGTPGSRLFRVAALADFWATYARLKPAKRRYYEIIPGDVPCRLYFDVEYTRQFNPTLAADSAGPDAMETMIKLVNEQLGEVFGGEFGGGGSLGDSLVILDSSTPVKFSQHLIFHLPHAALFRSNADVGRFVRVVAKTITGSQSEEIGGKLIVSNPDGSSRPIFDQSVYTKNRNFRIYLSTKLGREAPLLLAENCRFYSHKHFCEAPNGEASQSRKSATDRTIFYDSLIVPADSDSESDCKLLALDEESASSSSSSSTTARTFGRGIRSNSNYYSATNSCQNSVITGDNYCDDQYKPILDHIRRLLQDQNPKSFIRRFSRLDRRRLVADVGGNRFCHRIGREHRSNHVMIIVDLDLGCWYQKCHDPDCQAVGFSSNYFPLPKALCDDKILDLFSQLPVKSQSIAQPCSSGET